MCATCPVCVFIMSQLQQCVRACEIIEKGQYRYYVGGVCGARSIRLNQIKPTFETHVNFANAGSYRTNTHYARGTT